MKRCLCWMLLYSFMLSILCINIAYAETLDMRCWPSDYIISQRIARDRAAGNNRTEADGYKYEIDISYDPEKYKRYISYDPKKRPKSDQKLLSTVTVKFSKVRVGDSYVHSFEARQRDYDNSNRLGFIGGQTTYLDNVVVIRGGYGGRFSYDWMLRRVKPEEDNEPSLEFAELENPPPQHAEEIDINPFTKKPLAPNEYLLDSYNWKGLTDETRLEKYIKNGQIVVSHELHFLPGLHTCTRWRRNGVPVELNPDFKPKEGTGSGRGGAEEKMPKAGDIAGSEQGNVKPAKYQDTYFKCYFGPNDALLSWVMRVGRSEVTIQSNTPVKDFELGASVRRIRFIKAITFEFEERDEKLTTNPVAIKIISPKSNGGYTGDNKLVFERSAFGQTSVVEGRCEKALFSLKDLWMLPEKKVFLFSDMPPVSKERPQVRGGEQKTQPSSRSPSVSEHSSQSEDEGDTSPWLHSDDEGDATTGSKPDGKVE